MIKAGWPPPIRVSAIPRHSNEHKNVFMQPQQPHEKQNALCR